MTYGEHTSLAEIDRRLGNIEAEMQKLSSAVVTLARIEERMAAQYDTNARFGKRLESIEQDMKAWEMRVVELETAQARVSWIERGVWIAITGVVAWIFGRNGG